jgi:diguanylate cyclase (GGDEF)-like protein
VAAVGAAVGESIHLLDHIKHQASHDPLTGLANRWLLDEALERRIAEGRRHRRRLGVLVIDLDRFKSVNDDLGHVGADEVLVKTATRLRGVCRDDDIVARWGGEEFVVVAELSPDSTLERLAQRVCEALRATYQGADGPVEVTASVGAAAWPDHGHDAMDILRAADDAAMRAKAAGRNRVALAAASPLSFEREDSCPNPLHR